jgi:uncharacterized protein YciI
MKAMKGVVHLLSEARRQEQAGQPEAAADLYQQIVGIDPRNRDAIRRLLILYRRVKNYRKELAVINAALAAFSRHDKTVQQAWMSAHPEAARAGKAILRSLGGQQVSSYGADPMVEQLLKRKTLVEKRAGVAPTPRRAAQPVTHSPAAKPAASRPKSDAAATRRAARAAKAEERKRKAEERKRKAEERAREQRERKHAAARPSLFIILLRYLVDLEEIDAAMEKHVAFLDKHFKSGAFLVAGRQVPRTGGVILARGQDRAAVERIANQDPFVKGELASVDIVEFKASKTGKGIGKLKQSLK